MPSAARRPAVISLSPTTAALTGVRQARSPYQSALARPSYHHPGTESPSAWRTAGVHGTALARCRLSAIRCAGMSCSGHRTSSLGDAVLCWVPAEASPPAACIHRNDRRRVLQVRRIGAATCGANRNCGR